VLFQLTAQTLLPQTTFTKRLIRTKKKTLQFGVNVFEPTSMFGNDLIITNASGDTLAKDYKLLSNWTSDVDDQRTVANHEYILVITDADF
jgi:hypothetical protein